MSAENKSRQILKAWLDKNYPDSHLPKSSLDLHNFINDVMFEFHRSLPQFKKLEIKILKEEGILSQYDVFTQKGKVEVMKLLK